MLLKDKLKLKRSGFAKCIVKASKQAEIEGEW